MPIIGTQQRQSSEKYLANRRVLIVGPKWCGKTTTAEQFAASVLYMDDPEKKEQNIAMSELNPKRLLKGAAPRLIDEWQSLTGLPFLILQNLLDKLLQM